MPVMMNPVDDDEFMPAKKRRTKKQKIRAKLSLSGRRTVSERRRQRRASVNLAAVHGILVSELRERREERAKVLRVIVRKALRVLAEADGSVRRGDHVRALQVAVAAGRSVDAPTPRKKRSRTKRSGPVIEPPGSDETAAELEDDEWLACVQRYMEKCPVELKRRAHLRICGPPGSKQSKRRRRIEEQSGCDDSSVTDNRRSNAGSRRPS